MKYVYISFILNKPYKVRHKSIINLLHITNMTNLQIFMIMTGVFNVFLYSQKYGTIYITVKCFISE
jgi:hypothetical protein